MLKSWRVKVYLNFISPKFDFYAWIFIVSLQKKTSNSSYSQLKIYSHNLIMIPFHLHKKKSIWPITSTLSPVLRIMKLKMINKVLLTTYQSSAIYSNFIPYISPCKYSLLMLQMIIPQSTQLVTHEIIVEPSLSNFVDEKWMLAKSSWPWIM